MKTPQQKYEDVLAYARAVQGARNASYGDAWVKRGWRGNLARVLSKADRLDNMLWRRNYLEGGEETIQDTVIDLINLAAFLAVNIEDGNEWGAEGRDD